MTSLEEGWWSYPLNSETVYTSPFSSEKQLYRLTVKAACDDQNACSLFRYQPLVGVVTITAAGEVALRANTVPLARQRLGRTGTGPRRQLLMSSVNARSQC